jgi:hypothetical protein
MQRKCGPLALQNLQMVQPYTLISCLTIPWFLTCNEDVLVIQVLVAVNLLNSTLQNKPRMLYTSYVIYFLIPKTSSKC